VFSDGRIVLSLLAIKVGTAGHPFGVQVFRASKADFVVAEGPKRSLLSAADEVMRRARCHPVGTEDLEEDD
jgi:hypothetical protein